MNKLVIAKRALQDIGALSDRDREKVIAVLERLQIDPSRDVFAEERAIQPGLPPIKVAPAGDWRIYFRYLPDESLLQVLLVAKRS